ncbi:MAG: hypothetical protein V8S93_15160 [Lachnospiraceae bacterium]
MKEKGKGNQPFRDKVFLVMLVMGLLTMVTAAGMATVKRGRGDEQKPYVDLQGQEDFLAGGSNANSLTQDTEKNSRTMQKIRVVQKKNTKIQIRLWQKLRDRVDK